MTDQTAIDWPTCDEDGCIGVRLTATPKCLAHASDEQRNAMLKQVGENDGVPLFADLMVLTPIETIFVPVAPGRFQTYRTTLPRR